MRPANLLPNDLRFSRRPRPGAPVAIVGAGVLVGALLVGAYVSAHSKVAEREQELSGLQAELATVPAPRRPVLEVRPELQGEKDQRLAALDEALAQRVAWDTVLRELALVLPEDVWLRTLSAKSPVALGAAAADPTTAAAQGLTMNGFTYSQEGVARLLTRLSLVPHLSNVQLQSSSSTEIGNRRIVGFTIAAAVLETGGDSR
ncbi:MAG: PilN domain-containing protein [Gaiellaceae bacterium]